MRPLCRPDFFAALAIGAALAASGCFSAPAPLAATADALGTASGGPGGLLGTARTAAPAAVAVARSWGALNVAGGLAVLAGCVCMSLPAAPTGIGWGLALGGLALLCAGLVLPLIAGWLAAGVVCAFAVFAVAHFRPWERLTAAFLRLKKPTSTP